MTDRQPRYARASVSFTRPADTTAYATGDEIIDNTTGGSASNLAFDVTRGGNNGLIIGAKLYKSGSGTFTGGARLYLFRKSVTHAGDNSSYAPSDADMIDWLGYVDFPAGISLSNNTVTIGAFNTGSAPKGIVFSDLADARNVYGILVALGAYTPANAEAFRIELEVEQT